MTENIAELDKFIKSTIDSITKGIEGSEMGLKGEIEFELAIVNLKEGGGGLKVYVADATGKYKKEEISKIKFKIGKNQPNWPVMSD